MAETNADVAKLKLLESHKMAQNFFKEIHELDKPVDKMLDLLTAVAKNRILLEKWAGVLRKISVEGAVAYFDDDPEDAESKGIDEDALKELEMLSESSAEYRDVDKEPWHIPGLRDVFVTELRKEYMAHLDGLDPLTELGAMSGGIGGDEKNADDWNLYNPDTWTAWSRRRGANAVEEGGVKSGKTNTALLIAEYHLLKNYRVVANIFVDTEEVPAQLKGFRYCPNLSSQLREICYARKAGLEVLLDYDEGGLYWNKIQTIQRPNIDQSKLLLCYGKFHANVWFISHFGSAIPTIMATTAVMELKKTTPSTAFVSIKEGMKLSPRHIINVPETTLPYDPDQFQYFDLDMHVDSLFEFASTLTGEEDQWDEILKYVKSHAGERSEDEVDPKSLARTLHRKYRAPVRQIAAIMSKPKSTIYDWVKDISTTPDIEPAET